MKKRLVLFTQSYPYTLAAEQTFLNEEINHLNKYFDKIIIVPRNIGGEKVNVPKEVFVDESLANRFDKKFNFLYKLLNGLRIKLIFSEIIKNPKIIFSLINLLKLILHINELKVIEEWFYTTEYQNDSLIYTYWFTSVTNCISLQKVDNKIKVITRVHGADLYLERNNNYIPFRKTAISKINKVYCVSKAGLNYLNTKYPSYSEKYFLSRIGVKSLIDNTQINKNEGNIFRIVSCSSIISLKRVDVIIRGIIEFASKLNNKSIEYYHFGGGPLIGELHKIKSENSSDNLQIFLEGDTPNEGIIEFYRKYFIDIFVNASLTEGGCPVAIQEAQAFGIPFIGPDTGGVPEMIFRTNGFMLRKKYTKSELADTLCKYTHLSDKEISKLRENSYENWKRNFNADINFEKFAKEISSL